MDLTLNNLQGLKCHKTKQTKPNSNNSIPHYLFVYTPLNCSKYCYVIPIIQFRCTAKEFQVLLFNTNNSIQHYLFICSQYGNVSRTIQLNISHLFIRLHQGVQFLTIQFNISHLFAHSLNFKKFYLTHR